MAEHATIASCQLGEVAPQKADDPIWWRMEQPPVEYFRDVGIELLLRAAMRETAPFEPSQVTIELRADVPQFVHDGCKLLAKRKIEKPREIESHHIEHLLAIVGEQSLDGPFSPPADREGFPTGESQWCERGIQSMRRRFPGLGKTNSHPRHINMGKLRGSFCHVSAKLADVPREIEPIVGVSRRSTASP